MGATSAALEHNGGQGLHLLQEGEAEQRVLGGEVEEGGLFTLKLRLGGEGWEWRRWGRGGVGGWGVGG